MPKFKLDAEAIGDPEIEKVKTFCRKNKIPCRTKRSEIFTRQVVFTVEGETKRIANKVQKFIWDECNFGAFCEITKA